MRVSIPSVLWAWALLSPLLFRLLPGRDAAIACLLVGWAVLPNEAYPPLAFGEPKGTNGSAHAVSIAADPLVNKATAIGLGCLAGLALFDRRTFGGLRFEREDWPMVAWCLMPIASAAANRFPFADGLAQSRHLGLAWGVPYLMGRAYLADEAGRVRFALGLVMGGLLYLPACLVEVAAGPRLYPLVYGPHPYLFEGAARAFGSRPLVFLEHGNQLGLWLASSAVAATWLWASGSCQRPWGLPGGLTASVLIALTVLCQSHTSIILMGTALLPLFLGRSRSSIRGHWRMGFGLAVAALVLVVLAVAARGGFDPGSIRLEVRDFFRSIQKTSFTWRLARSADYLPIALERPLLGWCRPTWAAGGKPFLNPVNLGGWLLAFGQYGLLGLSAWFSIWIAPSLRALRSVSGRHLIEPRAGATGALLAVVAINGLDGLANSVIILPVLAAIGSLARSGRSSG